MAAPDSDAEPVVLARGARPGRGGSRSRAVRCRGAAGSCPARTRCRRRAGRGPRRGPPWIPPGRRCARRASGSRRRCPAPARPCLACAVMPSARPRSRSQPRSDTVALLPGITITSASARSAGSVTQRTSTPGSHASASTSVEFEMRGNRIAATRSQSRPRGGCGSPTTRCASTDTESSVSSHSPSV